MTKNDNIVLATCNQRTYMEQWLHAIQACIHNYRLKEQNFLMRMSMIGSQNGLGVEQSKNNANVAKDSSEPINKKISTHSVDENKHNNVQNHIEVNTVKKDGDQTSLFNLPEDNSNDSLQDFKIDKKIGSGSFGKVYLVTNKKNNLQFALKILNKKHLYNRNQIK